MTLRSPLLALVFVALQGNADVPVTCDGSGDVIEGAHLETAACPANDTEFDTRAVSWVSDPSREGCYLKVETPVTRCDGLPVPAIEGPPMETENDTSPWIAGQDFPADQPCPPEAKGSCWFPRTVPTRPCPAQGCYRDQIAKKP